jgi:hypothetical protein
VLGLLTWTAPQLLSNLYTPQALAQHPEIPFVSSKGRLLHLKIVKRTFKVINLEVHTAGRLP